MGARPDKNKWRPHRPGSMRIDADQRRAAFRTHTARAIVPLDDADELLGGITREDVVALLQAGLLLGLVAPREGGPGGRWYVLPGQLRERFLQLSGELGLAIRPGVGALIVKEAIARGYLPRGPKAVPGVE